MTVDNVASTTQRPVVPNTPTWAIGAGAAVVIAFVVTMRIADVPVVDSILFLGSQVLLVVVPGTLVWRRLRAQTGPLLEDAALGAGVGHTINLFAYIAFRAVDLPALSVVVPICIIALSLLGPALRTGWRGLSENLEVPAAVHAVAAIGGVYLLAWAVRVQGFNPVGVGAERGQGTDFPYLLGLAAELKHHVPPEFPFVDGEPLRYHWFVFADVAATHWRTGIELDLLTFRLAPMWLLLVTIVAFGAVARRVTRSVGTAFLAIGIAALVGSVVLPGWGSFSELEVASGSLLNRFNWAESPTQGFALLLSMPLVLLLIECVRAEERSLTWGRALLIGGLAAALLGAKAPFVPVLGAGLVAVLAHRACSGRVDRRAIGLGLALLAILVAGRQVLFGGESQGLSLNPRATLERLADSLELGAGQGSVALVATGLMLAILWMAPLLGAAGKLTDTDPAVWFLVGVVSAGALASLLLAHPGLSQMFFVRAGFPWGALLAAWGLFPRLSADWSAARAALLLGALVDVVLLAITAQSPGETGQPWIFVWLVVHAAGLFACLVGAHVLRRATRTTLSFLVLMCVMILGLGAGGALTDWLVPAPELAFEAGGGPVPEGGIAAARYIREHSDPEDLVATNAHCALPDMGVCDTRSHWIAAWTERRVLVEGWGYAAEATRDAVGMADAVTTDFWDQGRLSLNDDLFAHPSQETLTALLEAHSVRWLLVDDRFPADVDGLTSLVPDHRRFGDAVVFQLG